MVVHYAPICGSDLGVWNGFEPVPWGWPCVVGHEFSGTIESMGPLAKGFEIGDRVVARTLKDFCGHCHSCLQGRPDKCPNGRHSIGFNTNGTLTDYVLIDSRMAFKLPDHIDMLAASAIEPTAATVRAVFEIARVKAGDTVAIMGAGSIGLMVLQGVKACGAKAILIDLSSAAHNLEVGKELGADYIIENDKCNSIKEVRQLTKGVGVDIGFECAGHASTISQLLLMIKSSGSMVEVAVPTEEGGPKISTYSLACMQEIQILSAFDAHMSTWIKTMDLVSDGVIDPGVLMSKVYPLDQFFEVLENKDPTVIKPVFSPLLKSSCRI